MRKLTFHNSNRLVFSSEWDIGLSKTGYIREAGRCLVMQSTIGSKPVIIVLLDSMKKTARISDANFLRRWLSGVNDRVQQSTRSYLSGGG
jgi:D-alanyl-D-alanine endopeptidase (penicillin-binding protein 7)